MKLADVKKLCIRRQSKIHFKLRDGQECIVTEHGIAQIPGIRKAPDFSLEDELAAAGEFLVEPVTVPGQKNAPRPRTLKREELTALTSAAPGTAATAEHDDE